MYLYPDASSCPELRWLDQLGVAERRSPAAINVEAFRRTYGLTARQLEVAQLLSTGMSTKRSANQLGISPPTARRHTEQIFLKLGIHSRAQFQAALLEAELDARA